jgi:6-phosphofructokinase
MDTVESLSDYAAAHGKHQNFIGVPKTIGNDLPITDHCPGFGSACKYIATTLKEVICDNAVYGDTKKTVAIVEIMGRHAGWLTASAALAKDDTCCGVDAIYLPEVAFDIDNFVKEVEEMNKIVQSQEIGKCIGGSVIVPLCYKEEYGGFYFYAQHLVEIMTTIFGEKVTEVFATKTDLAVNVIAKYSDFNVTLNFLQHTYSYGIVLFGEKEFKVSPITFTSEIFSEELKDTLDLLKGGEMKKSYGSFINPVFIMSAILKSIESGKWEKIEKVEI